jgi:serine/threonine protein kinase
MSTLLAKGAYGCVFRPRITCSGASSRDNKRVTKVQAAGVAAENELAVGAVVKRIPNATLHFGPALSSCRISSRAIGKDIVKACAPIEGARDLELITFDYVPNVDFATVLAAAVQSSEDLYLAINSYTLLLRSLTLLSEAGVVQLDLKPENVLYDWVNHRPIIIDFGIAIDLNSLKPQDWGDRFFVYAPDYYVWPIDVHYICYLVNVNDRPSLEDVRGLVTEAVSRNKGLAGFSSDFRDEYTEAAISYYGTLVGRPPAAVVGDLLEFAGTWDTYSLSVMYLRALGAWSKARYANNRFISTLTQTLLQSMAPIPSRRPKPGEAVSAFNSIFYSDQPFACDILDLERFRASLTTATRPASPAQRPGE